jgi:peflin
MYGPNYGGGYHHAQSSSRTYQNPSQLGGSYSSASGPYNGDPQLLQWFNAVDTDRSGSISVAELQAALVNGQHSFLILSPIVG